MNIILYVTLYPNRSPTDFKWRDAAYKVQNLPPLVHVSESHVLFSVLSMKIKVSGVVSQLFQKWGVVQYQLT